MLSETLKGKQICVLFMLVVIKERNSRLLFVLVKQFLSILQLTLSRASFFKRLEYDRGKKTMALRHSNFVYLGRAV